MFDLFGRDCDKRLALDGWVGLVRVRKAEIEVEV